MPQFKIYIAQSLDGYIATADGRVDWLAPYKGGDDAEYAAFIDTVDTVVMGHTCYRQRANLRPFGDKRVVVLSRGSGGVAPGTGGESGIESYQGNITVLSDQLRREAQGDVWIMGGAQTIGAFLVAGQIDDMILYTMPELLGDGVRLFPPGGPRAELEKTEHKAFPCGVMRGVYRVIPQT